MTSFSSAFFPPVLHIPAHLFLYLLGPEWSIHSSLPFLEVQLSVVASYQLWPQKEQNTFVPNSVAWINPEEITTYTFAYFGPSTLNPHSIVFPIFRDYMMGFDRVKCSPEHRFPDLQGKGRGCREEKPLTCGHFKVNTKYRCLARKEEFGGGQRCQATSAQSFNVRTGFWLWALLTAQSGAGLLTWESEGIQWPACSGAQCMASLVILWPPNWGPLKASFSSCWHYRRGSTLLAKPKSLCREQKTKKPKNKEKQNKKTHSLWITCLKSKLKGEILIVVCEIRQ